MYKFLLIGIMTLFLNGCSFLPRFTFDRAGSTPQQTQKSSKLESCAGEYKVNDRGEITYCSKGYKLSEQNYKQADRKYTWQESISNFIRNLTGWGFPLLILACVFIPGFGGALLGFILNNVFGIASKGFKSLIRGIQAGKDYVRDNGNKYTPEQREIYIQGMKDLLDKIDEEINDPAVDKEIAKLRTELKWK